MCQVKRRVAPWFLHRAPCIATLAALPFSVLSFTEPHALPQRAYCAVDGHARLFYFAEVHAMPQHAVVSCAVDENAPLFSHRTPCIATTFAWCTAGVRQMERRVCV